uniref:Rubrerythrin family protein n=1 Tax=Geoglobus ahangari TaxID=113653 RepID=A0A7C4WE60_9EURY
MTPEEILKKAIELEKEAIQTYNEMKKDADPETSELLDYLISQEQEHIRLLSDRLKAVKLMRK